MEEDPVPDKSSHICGWETARSSHTRDTRSNFGVLRPFSFCFTTDALVSCAVSSCGWTPGINVLKSGRMSECLQSFPVAYAKAGQDNGPSGEQVDEHSMQDQSPSRWTMPGASYHSATFM